MTMIVKSGMFRKLASKEVITKRGNSFITHILHMKCFYLWRAKGIFYLQDMALLTQLWHYFFHLVLWLLTNRMYCIARQLYNKSSFVVSCQFKFPLSCHNIDHNIFIMRSLYSVPKSIFDFFICYQNAKKCMFNRLSPDVHELEKSSFGAK